MQQNELNPNTITNMLRDNSIDEIEACDIASYHQNQQIRHNSDNVSCELDADICIATVK